MRGGAYFRGGVDDDDGGCSVLRFLSIVGWTAFELIVLSLIVVVIIVQLTLQPDIIIVII